ncbi:MAG: flagellin [Oscillospiraceae bacterium]|nr:flagellin [Oscillospiraceae bacterium]
MRIQNNIVAMNTHRQLAINQTNQAKSTEKLSSGYRINRAADDAAGLAISEKMRAQVRGLNRASMNAQDGISMIQAAEGALQEAHSILQRIRELSVQGANDVNQAEDREAIVKEINQLGVELDRIAGSTVFNGKYILSGIYDDPEGPTGSDSAFAAQEDVWAIDVADRTQIEEVKGALNLQVGANTIASDVIQVRMRGVGAKDLLKDAWVSITEYSNMLDPLSFANEGFNPEDVSPPNDDLFNLGETVASDNGEYLITAFQSLINVIDGLDIETGQPLDPDLPKTGLNLVSELRSELGAVQNRLEHTIANVDTISENLQAAESRIRDVDMAKEMMAFTTSNILNQAATAMLAQANQLPQTVLSLLR